MKRAIWSIEEDQKNDCAAIIAFILNTKEEFSTVEGYIDFLNIFSKYNIKKTLPLHCKIDLVIKLEPGTTSLFSAIYHLLNLELKELKSYLEQNLALRFMELYNSRVRVLILLV